METIIKDLIFVGKEINTLGIRVEICGRKCRSLISFPRYDPWRGLVATRLYIYPVERK